MEVTPAAQSDVQQSSTSSQESQSSKEVRVEGNSVVESSSTVQRSVQQSVTQRVMSSSVVKQSSFSSTSVSSSQQNDDGAVNQPQQEPAWQPPPQQEPAWQPPPQEQPQPPWPQEQPPDEPAPAKDHSDLPQDNIKSSLKEIICDLERADLADGPADLADAPQESQKPQEPQVNGETALPNGDVTDSAEERRKRMDRQTSTTTLEQALLKEHTDGTLAALAALLSPAARTSVAPPPPPPPPQSPPPPPRQPRIPLHNLNHLLQSVQIAQELNMLNRTEETIHESASEEQHYINHIPDDDRSRGGPTHIDLERLFTPATDSGESTPARKSRIYASSSFYGPEHPTVEEQVELARRISSSLSDISNQRSKGQTMYVNRKKRSAGWVHSATDEGFSAPTTPVPDAAPSGQKDKPVLKLVMDPRGQVQDLWSLQKQGVPVAVDPSCGALSPEVCFHLVRDLNAPKGKGAELFAKRRKKSEKWVVDETTVRSSSTTSIMESSTSPAPKLPVPAASYLTNGTAKVHTVQRMNEIQEKFSQPRLKLVKSPWEAALETGSVDGAFQDAKLPPLSTPSSAPVPPPRTPAVGTPTWTATTTAATVRPLSTGDASLYAGRAPRGWGQYNASNQYGDSALLSFRGPPEEPAPLLLREAQGPAAVPASASAPEPPPRTVFLDYSLLQNYNTAPRGWGGAMDYYRPVTFSKPIAATDL